MSERYPIIGAHVTTAGGLLNGVRKAKEIGASAIQIFSSPPQQWKPPSHSTADMTDFKAACIHERISPVFVHGSYLINLASDRKELVSASVSSLIADMRFCSIVGARGVIFHTGSHPMKLAGDKRNQVITALESVLNQTPEDTLLIVENSAGAGSTIGGDITDLAVMKTGVRSSRLAFCIDTAHAFASGYDLRTAADISAFINLVDRTIGIPSVVAIHANDAKVLLGSNRDRHENIGRGTIGEAGFHVLLTHPALRSLPFILETPGTNRQGPDVENIDILKRLSKEMSYETY